MSTLRNDNIGVVDSERKRFRSSRYEYVDESLKWSHKARDQKVPVLGPLLLSKAKGFGEKLGNHNLQCSEGWQACFKKSQKNLTDFFIQFNIILLH